MDNVKKVTQHIAKKVKFNCYVIAVEAEELLNNKDSYEKNE